MFACSFPLDIQHSPRVELDSKIDEFQIAMDQQHYEELVDRKRGLPYPERMSGHHSMKSNLRQEAKLYTLDGDLLRRGGLPVLREADLEEEVEKIHGRFGGLNHNCGMRKLEQRLRQNWHCIGLRTKLERLCRKRCFQCHMSTGTVWFRATISKFRPLDVNAGREVCSKFDFRYIGVPTVEFALPFRSPASVEAIAANGNCVFLSVLHGIGADYRHHGKLRSAVFTHMENESIQSALRAIYQDSFEECVGHRSAETNCDQNVCGIVIHALASLLGVDILIHWVAEDGKLEWMLGLASLQKGVWGSNQIGLRWVNSHVDFITKYK